MATLKETLEKTETWALFISIYPHILKKNVESREADTDEKFKHQIEVSVSETVEYCEAIRKQLEANVYKK